MRNPFSNVTFRWLVALTTISLIAAYRWLLSDNITAADTGYLFSSELSEKFDVIRVWKSGKNLGEVFIFTTHSPFLIAQYLLGKLGFDSGLSIKIVYMLPIIVLRAVGPFLLAKQVLKNNVAAATSSLYFMFSVYGLTLSRSHLPLYLALSLSPLAYYGFLRFYSSQKLSTLLLMTIAVWLISVSDTRVLYIHLIAVLGLAGYKLLFEKFKLRVVLGLMFLVSLLVALNSYWLLGFSKLGALSSNQAFQRGLFGGDFFDIRYALLARSSAFSLTEESTSFVNKTILAYEWGVAIAVVIGLFAKRFVKDIAYWAVMLLAGILLTTQSSRPFEGLYLWLYENIPGFNAFREASKFYGLSTIATSVLVGASVLIVLNRNWSKLSKHVYVGAMVLLVIVPAYAAVSGAIKSLYVDRDIPGDYISLKKYHSEQSDAYGRELALPTGSRWMEEYSDKPLLNATNFLEKVSPVLPINSDSRQLNLTRMLRSDFGRELVNSTASDYITVPVRSPYSDHEFFRFYGSDRDFYVRQLEESPRLEPVENSFDSLTVFKNLDAREYFWSLDNLNQIPNSNLATRYWDFGSRHIDGWDLSFIDSKQDSMQIRNRQLVDLFDLSPVLDQVNDTSLQANFDLPKDISKNSVVYDGSYSKLWHRTKNNILEIWEEPIGVDVEGSEVSIVEDSRTAIAGLGTEHSHILSSPTGLTKIDDSATRFRSLGPIDAKSKIYQIDENILDNPSFEDGNWSAELKDCNNYDDRQVLFMEIDSAASTDGEKSLLFTSSNHTACIESPSIDIDGGGTYYLSFDAKARGSQLVGVDVIFDSGDTIYYDLPSNSSNWQTKEQIFEAPKAASRMRLRPKGYADDRNLTSATTNYDNFVLSPARLEVDLSRDSSRETVAVDTEELSLSYSYKSRRAFGQNLITNGSFEEGLWQDKVGDCNAFDDNPILAMAHIDGGAADGNKYLQLEATRHVACTSVNDVSVDENSEYSFSFWGSSPNAEKFGYYIRFNDANRTTVSERVPVGTNQDWQKVERTVSAPYGSDKATVFLYGYSNEAKGSALVTRYDDVQLRQIPSIRNAVFLVSETNKQTAQPSNIDYTLTSPTKKQVKIKGATEDGFYLAMSESYHPKWRAIIDNQKVSWHPWSKPDLLGDDKHFELNGWQNGWYIDVNNLCLERGLCVQNDDGSWDINLIIEFSPQRWFYVGSIVSGLSLFTIVGYLGINIVRRFRSLDNSWEARYGNY